MPSSLTSDFLRSHLLTLGFLFILLALLLELGSVDLWLADLVYKLSGASWSWRDAWLTHDLIHGGGRALVAVCALLLLFTAACSLFIKSWYKWRQGLFYLLASVIGSALIINILKELTHIDCPWDLLRYGGSQEYVRNFAALPKDMTPGACFPAGHASAGWAWFGLYFFALEYAPRWRKPILSFVLLMGLIFGLGQQLRGAHFLSHDLWTAGICWFVALFLYLLFYHRDRLRIYSTMQSASFRYLKSDHP